jgi:hypothetical protein
MLKSSLTTRASAVAGLVAAAMVAVPPPANAEKPSATITLSFDVCADVVTYHWTGFPNAFAYRFTFTDVTTGDTVTEVIPLGAVATGDNTLVSGPNGSIAHDTYQASGELLDKNYREIRQSYAQTPALSAGSDCP